MKRMTCWTMALLLCCAPFGKVKALVLPEEEPVLVYSMPLTQLLLTAEYDEVITEVGPFYQYSERYLGTKDVVTKAERLFILNGMKFRPMACADTTRTYVVQDSKNIKLQWVSLSPYGTLAGYNLSAATCTSNTPARHRNNANPQETSIGTETTRLMPLMEEQLMASSTAKMAEGAAKQIYRIRETRMNLLAGDVEKAPADGNAIKLMLQELDKREQELTALFVGRRTVIHHKHTFTYTPKSAGNQKKEESIIFRFSKYYGVVAADDLSGEPVKLLLSKNTHSQRHTDKPSQKPGTSLYYNLPGSGNMTVTYADNELINHPIDVAQWGVSVPLNLNLLATTPRITFNPLTGAIVSIER